MIENIARAPRDAMRALLRRAGLATFAMVSAMGSAQAATVPTTIAEDSFSYTANAHPYPRRQPRRLSRPPQVPATRAPAAMVGGAALSASIAKPAAAL